ncbi:MAG: OmpA family protein [Spirochaetaceae bacterium]|nr:OmpA family protein [Spirochaetaceae bacterium]
MKLKVILRGFLIIQLLFSVHSVFSQSSEPPPTGDAGNGRWTVTTRWDYRVRENGRYIGYANRELREVYEKQEEIPAGWLVNGDAWLLGATKKDGMPVAARLEESEAVSFTLGYSGAVIEAGNSFPRLRGFPTFPEEELQPGDYWEAPLDILIFGPQGDRAVLNQTASYRYIGIKPYMGRDARYFEVQWAIRYRGSNPDIDSFLNQVEGSHRVSLVVDAETGSPVMARDNLKENWKWADSRVENRDGFALIFWDGVPPLDSSGIKEKFKNQFGDRVVIGSEIDDSENIVITDTPRGLSVTLMNLHFQPDLALLLPDDKSLLDELAGILKGIPDRTILVRGHTADVGRPEDEKKLSEERAKAIADELSLRGIDPRRLIYEGVGSDEPQASNDSESGRKQNRRVELLILED